MDHDASRRPLGWADRRGNGALILIVLLAIAIMLYLYFGGGNHSYMNQVVQTRNKGRELATDISTQQFTDLIVMYRDQNGHLPKGVEDMGDEANSFRDPWGSPVTFTIVDDKEHHKTLIKYHSNGPDGTAGTPDDINKTDPLPY